MSQVAIDRHYNITDAVGVISVAAQFLVNDLKLLNRLILMAKDLDHLLAGHHFLDEAIDLGQLLLLDAEVLARPIAQIGC